MVTNGVSCGDWLLTTHRPAGQELAGVTRVRLEKIFREIQISQTNPKKYKPFNKNKDTSTDDKRMLLA